MHKKIAILTICFNSVFMSTAFAHPPSDIKITYDPNTKVVTAVIYHNVSDPVKHYIKKVDIGLNGKEILSQTISQEDNNLTQTVSCLIPDAKAGDTLSVEGYCNLSGNLTKSIKIP